MIQQDRRAAAFSAPAHHAIQGKIQRNIKRILQQHEGIGAWNAPMRQALAQRRDFLPRRPRPRYPRNGWLRNSLRNPLLEFANRSREGARALLVEFFEKTLRGLERRDLHLG